MRSKIKEIESMRSNTSSSRYSHDRMGTVRSKLEILISKMNSFIKELEYLEKDQLNLKKGSYEEFKNRYDNMKEAYRDICKVFISNSIELCQDTITLFENIQKAVSKRKQQVREQGKR